MKSLKNTKSVFLIASALIIYTVSVLGCSSANQFASEKSGAVLWGENCMRCHSNPSPTDFSDTQWETAVLHMEIRANLTKDEADKIVEFLKSAN